MAHSKYSDEAQPQETVESGGFSEHALHLTPVRKYDPAAGGDNGEGGICSHLHEFCTGDWSWKPGLDRSHIVFGTFRTFRGVPPGGAELSHSAGSTNFQVYA